MDIRIEGALDGIETARLLRQRFDVPIIFLTAYADEATVARAKQTEAHGYVVKPFRAGELRSAIEIALHKHAMEAALKVREHWLTTTLRAIGDAVMAVDGRRRHGAVREPGVPKRCWACQPAELRGRPLPDVFQPIDERTRLPIALPTPREVANGKTLELGDAALIGPHGERPIEDSFAAVVDERGRLLGSVIVFRDVSEARRLRERVALSDRMASLGTLAAGVALTRSTTPSRTCSATSFGRLPRSRAGAPRTCSNVKERLRRSAGALLEMVEERSTHAMAEALLEIKKAPSGSAASWSICAPFSRPGDARPRGRRGGALLDWALRVTEPENPHSRKPGQKHRASCRRVRAERRHPARSGFLESALECRAIDRRRACAFAAGRGHRQDRRAVVRGHRHRGLWWRDERRGAKAHLRAVFHDQAGRQGDRARSLDLPRHRDGREGGRALSRSKARPASAAASVCGCRSRCGTTRCRTWRRAKRVGVGAAPARPHRLVIDDELHVGTAMRRALTRARCRGRHERERSAALGPGRRSGAFRSDLLRRGHARAFGAGFFTKELVTAAARALRGASCCS